MGINSKFELLSNWKTELISSAVILLCLLLVSSFPVQGNMQIFSSILFFLFILPVLYIKFILKQDLDRFGFNLKNKLAGLRWSLAMLIVSFLVVSLLMHFYEFEQKYLIPAYLAQSYWSFLFYELVLVNFLLFIQEFFFRGFVLFSFAEKLNFFAPFVQFLIFALFLAATDSIGWKAAPSIILSLTGGIVAYKSKSIIYPYLTSLLFMIILDAYIIYLFK